MPLDEDYARAREAQQAIIQSPDSVIVRACPGAGKTRVLVERSLRILTNQPKRRGVAILSFSNSAVDEITSRFGQRLPPFPSFVGTFDSFLWRFLIAPFGAESDHVKPRLIPDLGNLGISPTNGVPGAPRMREYPMRMFDPETGQIRNDLVGEDIRIAQQIPAGGRYQARARGDWRRAKQNGLLDHEAARKLALQRVSDEARQPILDALAHRFAEVLVDEAQDCNPADLQVVQALRGQGVRVSVIGDFDQAIYGFRHGAPPELDAFAAHYPAENRHALNANFRSVEGIARAAVCFRRGRGRVADTSLVDAAVVGGVHIIPYRPRYRAVSGTIVEDLRAVLDEYGISPSDVPIVAHREKHARRAAGLRPLGAATNSFTVQLANTVAAYHAGKGQWRTQVEALKDTTALVFRYWGMIPEGQSFHQVLSENDVTAEDYRREAMSLAEELKPDLRDSEQPRNWVERCKEILDRRFPDGNRALVRMPSEGSVSALTDALSIAGETQHPISTVHQVKGQEFQAICIVIPPSDVVDLMERLENNQIDEPERVLYVGMTRAKRVCVFALPDAVAARFRALLGGAGAPTQIFEREVQ